MIDPLVCIWRAINRVPSFLSKSRDMKLSPQLDPSRKHPSCDGGCDMQSARQFCCQVLCHHLPERIPEHNTSLHVVKWLVIHSVYAQLMVCFWFCVLKFNWPVSSSMVCFVSAKIHVEIWFQCGSVGGCDLVEMFESLGYLPREWMNALPYGLSCHWGNKLAPERVCCKRESGFLGFCLVPSHHVSSLHSYPTSAFHSELKPPEALTTCRCPILNLPASRILSQINLFSL